MTKDIQTACFISAAAPIVIMLNGDFLYVGLWYYLILPLPIIIANHFLKTKAYTCSGMALALQLSFFLFFHWQQKNNEGLLGLVHLLFLSPGAAISSTIGLILLKNNQQLARLNGFTYGFGSFAIGASAGMGTYFSSL